MRFFSGFLLVLIALRASAKPESNISLQSDGFNGFGNINGAYGSSLPVFNTHIRSSTVENPTVNFPSCIPPTTVSESRHCFKTLVRPQIRNEIITVPTIDRIVRTVATPIVETIDCGGTHRLATFTQTDNALSGLSGTKILSELIQRNTQSASGKTNNEFFNDSNAEKIPSAAQKNNILNEATSVSNGVHVGFIARPLIYTFQTTTGKDSEGQSNAFSANLDFSNGGRKSGFQVSL